MINNDPDLDRLLDVWKLISAYIENNRVSEAGSVFDDNPTINGLTLITELCDIVGYYDYPEEEE